MATMLTEERLMSIPDLLKAGWTKEQIAEKFGCKVSTMVVRCSQWGISLRKGGRRPKSLTPTKPRKTLHLSIGEEMIKSLQKTADQLGRCDAHRLATDLIKTIINDELFSAVLDE